MSYEFLWEPPYLLLHPQATPRGPLGTVYNLTYMEWSIVGSPCLCLTPPSLHAGLDIHLCYCAEGNSRSHVQPGINWVTLGKSPSLPQRENNFYLAQLRR